MRCTIERDAVFSIERGPRRCVLAVVVAAWTLCTVPCCGSSPGRETESALYPVMRLDQPQLGIAFLRACHRRNDTTGCFGAARLLRSLGPPEMAVDLYLRACRNDDRMACKELVDWSRDDGPALSSELLEGLTRRLAELPDTTIYD